MKSSLTYSRVLKSYVRSEQKCKRAIKSADNVLIHLQKELDLVHGLQEEVDYFLEAPLVDEKEAEVIMHQQFLQVGGEGVLNRSRIRSARMISGHSKDVKSVERGVSLKKNQNDECQAKKLKQAMRAKQQEPQRKQAKFDRSKVFRPSNGSIKLPSL